MADRKWYVIDAAGKRLPAALLPGCCMRGKNKTTFTNVDCGDNVISSSTAMRLSVKQKLEKKFHRTLIPGWIGGLKGPSTKT